MEVWQYFLLFAAVLLGGTVAMFFKNSQKLFPLVMAFCGAYILGILILHLLPDVYGGEMHGAHSHDHHDHAGGHSHGTIGFWVLGGFFLQLLLEQFSMGIEHGHAHDHDHSHISRPTFAIQVMIALSIHAFVEGLPLAAYHDMHEQTHAGAGTHNHLYLSVILHKAPEAFALVLLLVSSHFKSRWIWLALVGFSLMSPFGAYLGHLFDFDAPTLQKVVAVVVGTLIHIATTILFEGEHDAHHHNGFAWKKLIAVGSGIGLAMLTLL
jgi:zinc transporter ZupT